MGCIDVGHLGEFIIKLTEVATNLRIADGAGVIELVLHIIPQFDTDIRQRILIS